LILSDYSLPVFSANEVLTILKQRTLDIPCIVISGYISEETAVSLMKAGAYDFIPKENLSRLVPAIRREVAEARNRSEKRKVEENLRRNEKLITGIASALGEGLIVSNVKGDVIFVNPEAKRLLGWNKT
jgi:DNA-binding NtrC family response regulator